MLIQIIVLLLAAVILVPLCARLALGGVIGYLLAGLLVGPGVLALVGDVEDVRHLSEFGVVFLLFVIGLELRWTRLWSLREQVFGHGALQVTATAAAIALIASQLLDLRWQPALVIGCGLALSSTALVLQALAEKKQLTERHGREAFAILLFQDLAVIPLLALLPLLGDGSALVQTGWQPALRSLGILLVAVLASRLLLRPLFRLIVTFGGRDIFTATALLLVVGSALAMVWAGLSMSLGAFLAGVLLADSEYRHELEAAIEPFKGLLLGLFFMSIGMTVDLPLLFREPTLVVALMLCFVAIKVAVVLALRGVLKLPADSTRKLALTLAQGGEFAFVLFASAAALSIFDQTVASMLTLLVALSMLVAPLLLVLEDKVLARRRAPEQPSSDYDPLPDSGNPAVIVGFGRVGQMIGRVLHTRGIAFTALEINPQQIDFVRKFGNKVYYGDATRLDLLEAAGTRNAKLFVLAVGDVETSLNIGALVRRHFPNVPIYARSLNRAHSYRLMELGVDMEVRETLHSSMELARGILQELGMEPAEAARTIDAFKDFDARLLQQQFAIHGDEQALIASVKQASDELRALFEAEAGVVDRVSRPED
jgi:glutathione-regulated potassium-efflux system ancillary protein KefC/glutathione-regulated potassium-efflux system protein KefB